jgi:hypothetical protein
MAPLRFTRSDPARSTNVIFPMVVALVAGTWFCT